MGLRDRIETGFVTWGRFVVRRRWWVLAACLALSGTLASRLPEIRVDNSDEAFLHADDPARMRYDAFKDRFDREDRVMVVLRPPEVFDLAFFEWLRTLHREIEREVPYVEEVTSLINARNTRGEGDELIVEDLMEEWPETAEDVARLRRRVLSNPLYIDYLISGDTRYTVISLKPFTYSTLDPRGELLGGFDEPAGGAPAAGPRYLTDVEGSTLVETLQALLARREGSGVEAHVVGGPTFDHHMTQKLQRDVTVLLSLSVLIQVAILFFIFRRPSAVVLPLVVVTSAMLSTMGFMVWLDIPFSITLNMLPAFLMVVGLCDSVHLLTIFFRRLGEGDARDEAIARSLGHSGLAVVMTSVTTAAGLLSFRFAELAPIAQLGTLAPTGVMLAMVYSLALLPALLAVTRLDPMAGRRGRRVRARCDRVMARAGDLACRHPWRVVAVTLLLVLAGIPGFRALHFSHDSMRWFPEDDPLRVALELVNQEFRGASSLEVVVDTGRENGLYEPDVLERIERVMRHSLTLSVDGSRVGKATSIVDVVKETHQALNENRSAFYALPAERELIAQELLLFENSGSDDLEELTDSRFQTARVTIRTRWVDAMLFPPFLEEVEDSFRDILGDGIGFELTGGAVLFTRVFEGLIYTMARSYVFALAVITPLMVLLIGSPTRGLVAMIPNLIPIYAVLAFMGWADIPLDASTLLIGGIIIGLAVDDTIHFMHKFGTYYQRFGDARRAVHETLVTTGSALLFTSVVLFCGNGVFWAAYMRNTLWFGTLVVVGVAVAFLADILLGPALMVLVTRRRGGQAPSGPFERSSIGFQ
jgi:predicted RND superfamily exporter protein